MGSVILYKRGSEPEVISIQRFPSSAASTDCCTHWLFHLVSMVFLIGSVITLVGDKINYYHIDFTLRFPLSTRTNTFSLLLSWCSWNGKMSVTLSVTVTLSRQGPGQRQLQAQGATPPGPRMEVTRPCRDQHLTGTPPHRHTTSHHHTCTELHSTTEHQRHHTAPHSTTVWCCVVLWFTHAQYSTFTV